VLLKVKFRLCFDIDNSNSTCCKFSNWLSTIITSLYLPVSSLMKVFVMRNKIILFGLLFLPKISTSQMPAHYELCLMRLVESSDHYKRRFGNRDIFTNKKWKGDASSDGHNLTFTIYFENTKVGNYNTIVVYTLDDFSKELRVKDTFPKYNTAHSPYDKKYLTTHIPFINIVYLNLVFDLFNAKCVFSFYFLVRKSIT
jgi:hypothetical protein